MAVDSSFIKSHKQKNNTIINVYKLKSKVTTIFFSFVFVNGTNTLSFLIEANLHRTLQISSYQVRTKLSLDFNLILIRIPILDLNIGKIIMSSFISDEANQREPIENTPN